MLRKIDDERIRELYLRQAGGLYWIARIMGNDSTELNINTFLPPSMRIDIEKPKTEKQKKAETREALMTLSAGVTGKHNAEFWRN
jgi:hypothetical protein